MIGAMGTLLKTPQKKVKTQNPAGHWLLTLTVMALPFSYIPHEIVRTGPTITIAVMMLAFLVGAKYGVLWKRTGAVDTVGILLALHVAFRLLVLSPAQFPDTGDSLG